MKKGLVILGLVACAIAVVCGQSYADAWDAYMVANNGNETALVPATYLDTVTPYLFLNNTYSAYQHSFYTTWAWQNGTVWDPMGQVNLASVSTIKDWLTLPNWSSMPTGQWRIATFLVNEAPTGDCCNGKCVYFERVTKPVPEPISTTLFLLGGGAMGLRIFRRKKQG